MLALDNVMMSKTPAGNWKQTGASSDIPQEDELREAKRIQLLQKLLGK